MTDESVGEPPVEGSAADIQSDESLVWSLRAFQDHQRAVAFVNHFSQYLCVYSSKVHQLYAAYDIIVPMEGDLELVVSPHLEEFLDTWYDIPEEAIKPAGFTILPGSVVQRQGAFLHLPDEKGGGKGRAVPLTAGLKEVSDAFDARDDVFLPVITKGDLRALRKQDPTLHLHRLDLTVMGNKSRFELSDMRNAIRKKLFGA